MNTPADTQTSDAPLPLFYQNPRPLDRAADEKLFISRPKHFRFAAKTNAIPLLADEFPMASAYYPIVFADGPMPVPAAIVGLNNDKNMFIDAQGGWRDSAYIPAYVRRYPFILMEEPTQKQLVLCIDDTSDMLAPEGEFQLFDKGEPSKFTQGAMEFCATLRQQGDATDAFVKALQEYNLLRPHDTSVQLPDGTRMQLKGFLIIDPQKFDQLPDNIYLEWRRKGWVGLVYAHLLSSHRWQYLANMGKAD